MPESGNDLAVGERLEPGVALVGCTSATVADVERGGIRQRVVAVVAEILSAPADSVPTVGVVEMKAASDT
ncbi:hypothetical protein LWC34_17640 [Kibdelosporangium philippinense]|uniref:Uncharacterized protein n=2 Tax=Kibdelosporangium philippinense TaxID=211113 RepID=A0ABS8ZC94_9PSEU|nr:hypothetical protein [Kibdelosporangium philippinense]MCE7004633.1 hypothetical protein [Kibdelosporangium philippinense]